MKTREINQAVKRINNNLSKLENYHSSIPISTIFSEIESNDLVVLQEDGTPWDGLICGVEGHIAIDMGDLTDVTLHAWGTTYKTIKHRLILTWYRMTSGRYEIVTYVS